jgi:hypothetical protein
LGTFWLKIEQFWPFEEISIFSIGGITRDIDRGTQSVSTLLSIFVFNILPSFGFGLAVKSLHL